MKENVQRFDYLDDVEIDYIFDCIKKYKKKDKRSIADKVKNYRMFIHKKTHTKSVCLKHFRDK